MGIDLLFVGGTVLPMTSARQRARVLAVEGSRIAFVGDEVPQALAEQARETIDLAGRTLIPGFIDTHANLTLMGLLELGLDAHDAETPSELLAAVRDFRRGRPRGRPLLAAAPAGMSETWLPDRTALDAIAQETPTLLLRRDGRFGVASGALAALLEAPGAGRPRVVVGPSGWLTGDSLLQAVQLVYRLLGRRDVLRGLMRTAGRAVEAGVTALQCFEGLGFEDDRDLRAVRTVGRAMGVGIVPYFQTTDARHANERRHRHASTCFTLGRGGSPHEDGGLPCSGPDGAVLEALVLRAQRRGMQVALHAASPAEAEAALGAVERAHHRVPQIDPRHRLEHCAGLGPEQVMRMAELGVAASVSLSDLEAPGGSAPLRALLDAGVLVGLGSCSPFAALDPMRALAAACAAGASPHEALAMLTSDAARLSLLESEQGTLVPGKRADLVVLDRDPLDTPADELASLRVCGVYLRGQQFAPRAMRIPTLYWSAFKGRLREAVGMA